MRKTFQNLTAGALTVITAAATTLACGTPTTPPPPPPDPPIVFCQIVSRTIDPDDPAFECVIVRYYRCDGEPLFQSNPMPLFASQTCLCAIPPLPADIRAAGAQIAGFSFSGPGEEPFDGPRLPPNAAGFGPFEPVDDPEILGQVSEFLGIYAEAAQGTVPFPSEPPSVFGFSGGPGAEIPQEVLFDVFVKIRIPRDLGIDSLTEPGARGTIGLFLAENGQVVVEPPAIGPGISLPKFASDPGASAIYKFKALPSVVPLVGAGAANPCPTDFDGNGSTDSADLAVILGNWGPCP